MELAPEEARVIACLIEKEATVPDSYPLTLNALRLACNQTSNRAPVVAYDDRTVENVVLSLKSMGLARFVHPSHGGRTVRYRHVADERWHLSKAELGVLAVLVLRGPQTAGEVRARTRLEADDGTVEEILDMLAARSPDPFAVRLERRPGEREARWAHTLSGVPEPGDWEPEAPADEREARPDLARDVAELWLRVERLEKLLGLSEAMPAAGASASEPGDDGVWGRSPHGEGLSEAMPGEGLSEAMPAAGASASEPGDDGVWGRSPHG